MHIGLCILIYAIRSHRTKCEQVFNRWLEFRVLTKHFIRNPTVDFDCHSVSDSISWRLLHRQEMNWLGRTTCFLFLWCLLLLRKTRSSQSLSQDVSSMINSLDEMKQSLSNIKKQFGDLICSLDDCCADETGTSADDTLEELGQKVTLLTTRFDRYKSETNSRTEKMYASMNASISYLQSSIERCCSGGATKGRILAITADDQFRLYLDGKKIDLSKDKPWNVSEKVPLPGTTKVIAVKGINYYADPGILASTADGFVITNSSWKCTNKTPKGWAAVGFDDHSWPPAYTVTPYEAKPIAGIRDDAGWIWTSDYHYKTGDRSVYCRLNLP